MFIFALVKMNIALVADEDLLLSDDGSLSHEKRE
jgi:hypothetical protein